VTILKKLFFVLIGDRYKSDLTVEKPYRGLTDEELVKTIIETKNTLLFGIIYDRYANKIYTKLCRLFKVRGFSIRPYTGCFSYDIR
jgi:RNA polymerase sigma-70 factor (ECF subfamily)